jgi:protein-S-isoprenylcysteine O-methyltransferase Ste14
MGRVLALVYGVISYLVFVVTFFYSIGWVTGLVVPRTIDDAPTAPAVTAVAINVSLLLTFAIQHNVMARPAFKKAWTRLVPLPIERSTFVLISSLILLVMFWQWRAMPDPIWDVANTTVRAALTAISLLGFAMVFYASVIIDHFELFGLRQVWLNLRGESWSHAPFQVRSLYRMVRHPLLLGFVIAFWAAPTMTVGRLLFAVVTTAWMVFSIRLEERDLAAMLGDSYRRYQRRTPMLIPLGGKRGEE